MAAPTGLSNLLSALQQSISFALELTPKLSGIETAKGGISLFDAKNELLLAYLQNLVFLILLKIRQAKNGRSGPQNAEDAPLDDQVVKKLVKLRLYLEKGVRPLEDKLRYQVEKVLRAADDAERSASSKEAAKKDPDSDADSNGGDEEGSSEKEEEEDAAVGGEEKDEHLANLRNRPNLSAMVRSRPSRDSDEKKHEGGASGVYKPPRLNPTVMPATARRGREERRRPLKSATLDEFIADEMSAAPVAEPSIGTNVVAGGRKIKTAAERKQEDERREYEERNFVRLPKESKKDRAKRAKVEGRSGRVNFGGEEWRDLGEGVDRINRLTKGKSSGSGTKALLDKSRKRGIDTLDGPRGSGAGGGADIGDRYHKRLKMLKGGRKDRGKKR